MLKWAKSNPLRTEQFGLHEYRLHRFLLQIRRVAVFVQNPLHHHLDPGAGAFAQRPVDGHALADLGDEFGGNDLQLPPPPQATRSPAQAGSIRNSINHFSFDVSPAR